MPGSDLLNSIEPPACTLIGCSAEVVVVSLISARPGDAVGERFILQVGMQLSFKGARRLQAGLATGIAAASGERGQSLGRFASKHQSR